MNAHRSYSLNPDLARQVGASMRITHSGPYIGRFTRAELVTSRQKSEGVEFTFESEDGQTADYLTCWTHNIDGRELYGLKVLNAILTCVRLREVKPQPGRVEERGGGTREAWVFPQLMARPIGLLLQREEYVKQDGSVGWKFNIVAPFEPASGKVAGEILSNAADATQLDRMVASVTDKTLPKRDTYSENGAPGHNGRAPVAPDPGSMGGFDDDIPF